MPYKDANAQRLYQRQLMQKRRAAARESRAVVESADAWPDDPAEALRTWSREVLRVPFGHPLAGSPMELPEYGVDFLRDALTHSESGLLIARKNAKSAIVAVYLLGRLVGPLRTPGYRAGVCSVNREKAGELWQQCADIAAASGLMGLRFRRAPRGIESATGKVDILSADRTAGHASGFDDAIFDELGLLQERHRELVNGLRSSVSARGGRFIALSIVGGSPFTREMLERRDLEGCAVHLYQAPEDAEIDDVAAWYAANPGLGTVKSLDYMRSESVRVLASPGDQAAFRAFDLNVPQEPSREMIVPLHLWRRCQVSEDDLPPREGECVLGVDLGASTSMTAACAIWPRTGRMEAWGAFPSIPPLSERSKADGQGGLYLEMEKRGELKVYSGRVTPVAAFLADVALRLEGENVVAVACDVFKQAEAVDGWERSGVDWPIDWRREGAGRDGAYDVRAFQRLVHHGILRIRESKLMTAAILDSEVKRDRNGNEYLEKARLNGRIDAMAAAKLAAGLAERLLNTPEQRGTRIHV